MCRIRNCLTQLYAKDITPDEKQELDEALQREVICLDILVLVLYNTICVVVNMENCHLH
jgi:hypothetical protein